MIFMSKYIFLVTLQQVKTNLFRNHHSHSSVHMSGPKTHMITMLIVRSELEYLKEG